MNRSIKSSIDQYIRALKATDWIKNEAYKFEFANYIFSNVNWAKQSNDEILQVLINSQKFRYTATKEQGVQFIIKSGRKDFKNIISHKDVSLFREFGSVKTLESIDWSNRSMSITGLSVWLGSLFPEYLMPAPIKGFDVTIKYLFDVKKDHFPKVNISYLAECQAFLRETWDILCQYPIEQLHIDEWNKYYISHPELNIKPKTEFSEIDKVWIVQDFHLFVYREVLKLYDKETEKTKLQIQDDSEPTAIEGKSVLARHMRYERNSAIIKKVKKAALIRNPMLNCEVCRFSFRAEYGDIGVGFIEAHHKVPFYEKNEERVTTKDDIALVCSNCHRMLHSNNLSLDVDQLKSILNTKK